MVYKIAQGFKYRGDDYWNWWIWIEAPDEQLDRIESVTYLLHRTFPNPVRKVTARDTKFKLQTAGWGTFTVHAKLHMKDKSEVALSHELELEYPSEKRGAAAAKR